MQLLLGDTDSQCPETKRFTDRIRYQEAGIATDVNTGEVEWGAGNMPTFGEELGILLIPIGYQEENHFDEGYQRVSNL